MKIWFCIGLTALCFGGWPLMARMAGKTGTTGAFIMAALALLPMIVVLLRQGAELPATWSSRWWLLIAGVTMGTGFIAYNFVITSSQMDVSVSVPTISTLMIIITTVGGTWFFSEPMTPRKMVGIMVLITGIILVQSSQKKPSVSDPPSSEIQIQSH